MRNHSLAAMLIPLAALTLPSAACADTKAEKAAESAVPVSAEIAAAVAAPTRSSRNVARDPFRRPGPVLDFFGAKGNQTIVEIWPGGGWYTEILAPLTKAGGGTLYAAAGTYRNQDGVKRLIAADPATYGHIKLASYPAEDGEAVVPDGVADLVVTFRNVHNWRFGGADVAQERFNAMFAMLKPGGVLGVVEHRLPEDMPAKMEETSGYMKKSSVIAFAEKAGFKLVGESEINANPKDTHDHPNGVWSLPPSFRGGDVDRDKFAAIGESDRMTLKFVKPAT